MACGTAAVITHTVGTAHYARPGVNCLAVEYGDYENMAHNILRLLQDSQLRLRLEREGRSTAAAYKWADSLAAFEQTMAEVMSTGELCQPVN
jgi:glycosyltransferase involved in cell wall biosynthesis